MIISEKQIMQLIAIAHAHAANMKIFGEYRNSEDVQELLEEIQNQQCEKLKFTE